jgi:hypothetical protein
MKCSTLGRNLFVSICPRPLSSLARLFKSDGMMRMGSGGLRRHHYSSCSAPSLDLHSPSLGVPCRFVGHVDHQGTQA